MKILLVSPKISFPDNNPRWLRIPQLILPLLAALTPPEHTVKMIEDEYDRLPLDEHWDVVGITAMTASALRAYELASLFKATGAKIILGGIHPSVLPDEAIQYADAVVIGEAEGIWPEVLEDVRHNQLKQFYHNQQPDISESPLPLREERRYFLGFPPVWMPIMASRGCPYDCEFCCVHRVYGRKQRHVSIEHIVRDIQKTGSRHVLFLDDNIGGVRSYALQLFKALKPLKLRWAGQASVRFILDDELFKAAIASGLKGLFVGVESVEPEARNTMSKLFTSIEPYEEAIRRCRRQGVVFHASVVFGLDEETPQVFDRTYDFLMRNSVPSVTPCILTPYPGTHLFERLMNEGRILHTNWSYYDHHTVCYQPKNMEPEELTQKYLEFHKRFFSFSSIFKRASAILNLAEIVPLCLNFTSRRTTKRLEERNHTYFNWLRQHKNGVPTFSRIPSPPVSVSTD